MRTTLAAVAAALAALALGYADLARGGTTVAPLLLLVAYAVLVPLALARLATRRRRPR